MSFYQESPISLYSWFFLLVLSWSILAYSKFGRPFGSALKLLPLMQTKMCQFYSNFKQVIACYAYKISFDNHKSKWTDNLCQIVRILTDLHQTNGTMGGEPQVRRTPARRHNHLLINSWFLCETLMKFNDIFHKCKTELFWFGGMISVTLILT